MCVVALPKPTLALIVTICAVCTILALGVAIQASGVRPYGEQEILEQVAREDSAFCQKFGIGATATQFADCMFDLPDLRQRHVDLLTAYSWL